MTKIITKEKYNTFFERITHSNLTIIVIITIFLLSAIVQYILFNFGYLQIHSGAGTIASYNGIVNMGIKASHSLSWRGWLSITSSSLAAALELLGIIFMARMEKPNSILFISLSAIFTITNACLIQYWFAAMGQLFILVLTLITFNNWLKLRDKEIFSPKQVNWFKYMFFLCITLILGLLLGYSMSFANGTAWQDPRPFLDASIFSLMLFAHTTLIGAFISCWYTHILIHGGNLVLYAFAGSWSLVIAMGMNLFFDVLIITEWTELIKLNKKAIE